MMQGREDPRADWNVPKPATIPRPTYWPLFLALAIVFVAYGIIFAWWFIVVGLTMFVVALAGWIGEIRHDHGGPEPHE
jgi:hypothetical protein